MLELFIIHVYIMEYLTWNSFRMCNYFRLVDCKNHARWMRKYVHKKNNNNIIISFLILLLDPRSESGIGYESDLQISESIRIASYFSECLIPSISSLHIHYLEWGSSFLIVVITVHITVLVDRSLVRGVNNTYSGLSVHLSIH